MWVEDPTAKILVNTDESVVINVAPKVDENEKEYYAIYICGIPCGRYSTKALAERVLHSLARALEKGLPYYPLPIHGNDQLPC